MKNNQGDILQDQTEVLNRQSYRQMKNKKKYYKPKYPPQKKVVYQPITSVKNQEGQEQTYQTKQKSFQNKKFQQQYDDTQSSSNYNSSNEDEKQYYYNQTPHQTYQQTKHRKNPSTIKLRQTNDQYHNDTSKYNRNPQRYYSNKPNREYFNNNNKSNKAYNNRIIQNDTEDDDSLSINTASTEQLEGYSFKGNNKNSSTDTSNVTAAHLYLSPHSHQSQPKDQDQQNNSKTTIFKLKEQDYEQQQLNSEIQTIHINNINETGKSIKSQQQQNLLQALQPLSLETKFNEIKNNTQGLLLQNQNSAEINQFQQQLSLQNNEQQLLEKQKQSNFTIENMPKLDANINKPNFMSLQYHHQYGGQGLVRQAKNNSLNNNDFNNIETQNQMNLLGFKDEFLGVNGQQQQQQQQQVDYSEEDNINPNTGNKKTDETKYKTEMCKNFEEMGRCNYGKKCRFAHGKHELVEKNLSDVQKYRSKECQTYHSIAYCPYGIRCMFKHDERTQEEVQNGFLYQKVLYKPEIVQNLEDFKSFHRLPVFSEIIRNFQISEAIKANEAKNLRLKKPQKKSSDLQIIEEKSTTNNNILQEVNLLKPIQTLSSNNSDNSSQSSYSQMAQQQQNIFDSLELNSIFGGYQKSSTSKIQQHQQDINLISTRKEIYNVEINQQNSTNELIQEQQYNSQNNNNDDDEYDEDDQQIYELSDDELQELKEESQQFSLNDQNFLKKTSNDGQDGIYF